MRRNRSTKRPANAHDLALAYLGVSSVDDVRMQRVIERHIARVLEAADGNLSLAAELLGVNRRTMQRDVRRRQTR
jgi:ActR/RegA family two-component response regulator